MVTISIITACYNAAATLQQTLNSVLSQDYDAIEHVIIDGGSTDGTVAILEAYATQVPYSVVWITEPDQGISDAFNKGVARATGDYLYFLGADDYFWRNDVLTQMMVGVDPANDTLVCGRVARVSEQGALMTYTPYLNTFQRRMLLPKMALPHQGLFTHQRFFEQHGVFLLEKRFSMDYELLLRAYHDFPPVVTKDVVVAAWRAGGVGHGLERQILAEYHRNRVENHVAPRWQLWLLWRWSLLKVTVRQCLQTLSLVKR